MTKRSEQRKRQKENRRKGLLEKHGAICHICGWPIDPTVKGIDEADHPPHAFSVDHYTPVKHGGRSSLDNFRPSHAFCNSFRGDRALHNVNRSLCRKLFSRAVAEWEFQHEEEARH